jgi:RimJ/RimL family protein N-acetyltransferase
MMEPTGYANHSGMILRPATIADRREIYEWAAHSDLTAFMMGPPDYPDAPVPSWEEFCGDYDDSYFSGDWPASANEGRSFLIEIDGTRVGHISCSPIETPSSASSLGQVRATHSRVELDIWLASSRFAGHGYGTAAIGLLVGHLIDRLGIGEFILRPSKRNPRAISAYCKAGFRELQLPAAERLKRFGPGDTDDEVVLMLIAAVHRNDGS